MKRIALIMLASLVASSLALAGDEATLDFIGFSRDGRHLAFEQYGTQDGSGFPYSEMYVVDVASNTLASSTRVLLKTENASLGQARSQTMAQSRAALTRYGIVRGNQGRFAEVAAKREQWQSFDFTALGRRYSLNLNETLASATPSCGDNVPKYLSLTLRFGAFERLIQHDTRLPASRACAYDYEVHSVFVFGRSLAVFVKLLLTGFEGPDVRWMVVTTILG
jgi:predicted secreted protein